MSPGVRRAWVSRPDILLIPRVSHAVISVMQSPKQGASCEEHHLSLEKELDVSQSEQNATIYILDQITAKPGKGKEVLAAYMERYAPVAKEKCGMTPVSRLVAPPMWLDDVVNTLFIMWSVKGTENWWWSMRLGATRNPEAVEFWQTIEPLIETRYRYFLSDVADVEALCNV